MFTVKQLIERLQNYDPDLEVVAGADNENEILHVYTANVYQGKDKPSKHCIWIDCKQENDDF